jgi:hypothetical protein
MSTKQEQIQSLIWAGEFLIELLDPKKTRGVPSEFRKTSLRILRHYPQGIMLSILLGDRRAKR